MNSPPKQINLFTKRAKAAKPFVQPESVIQESFFAWARTNERQFPILKRIFAVPNGGYRHKATAIAMKRQGVKAGVLDVCLPVARKGFAGLWIEFKTEVGKPSDEQKEWIVFLESEGHQVHVLRSWRVAANITVDYLNLPLKVIV